MQVSYFSWIRKYTGTSSEQIDLPDNINTIRGFVDWICEQDAKYKALFSHKGVIHFSVNDALVEDWDSFEISQKDQISLFSPIVGG